MIQHSDIYRITDVSTGQEWLSTTINDKDIYLLSKPEEQNLFYFLGWRVILHSDPLIQVAESAKTNLSLGKLKICWWDTLGKTLRGVHLRHCMQFFKKASTRWWHWAGMRAKKDQQEIEEAILQGKAESIPYLSELKQDWVLFKWGWEKWH